MIVRKVMFHTIQDVSNFVLTANEFPYAIDIGIGPRMVDAKSVVGVLSFGVPQELEIRIHAEEADDFLDRIEKIRGIA